MNSKKIPMRKCVGCNQSKPKQQLIRITLREEGPMPDPTGRANGRGVYLCKNGECFKLAMKKKAIGRGLQTEIDSEKAERLEKELAKYAE